MKTNFVVFHDSNETLEEEAAKEIDKENVNLSGRWNKYDLDNKCLFFNQWKVEKLDIRENQKPLMLRIIRDINFSCLKRFDINTNEIQSVQGVERLELPVIEEFYVNTNNLTNIRTFRKVHWPNLIKFYYNKNKTLEGKALCELKSCQLKDLNIQYVNNESQQCFDCRWVLKLETKLLQEIEVNSHERIKNHSFRMKAKSKYPSLTINTRNYDDDDD